MTTSDSEHPYPPVLPLPESLNDIQQLIKTASNSLLTHFAEMCEGAIIVDKYARIVWMNEHYPRRLGLKNPDKAIGQPVEKVIPSSLMREVVETGRPIMLDMMQFSEDYFVVMRLPLHNDVGDIIGGIGLMLLDDARYLAPIVSRYNQLHTELTTARQQLAQARSAKYTLSSLVSQSAALTTIKSQARRAARTTAPILIQGETGTGKELLAQAIHNASPRADKPFVAVNIAAIPESLLEAEFFGSVAGAYTGAERKGRQGKFKLAQGGTLFLDEIGDMPITLQAKLLRVLQEGEYEALGSDQLVQADVRIIAATSRDLANEVKQGRFRADLYYRLNVVLLVMPPLRERLDDLPILTEHLLETLSQQLGVALCELSTEALEYLSHYDWPGNVRELRNILERAVLMSDNYTLTIDEIKPHLPITPKVTSVSTTSTINTSGITLNQVLAQAERQAIQQALAECAGNKAKAATLLGISRTALYEKLKVLGLPL